MFLQYLSFIPTVCFLLTFHFACTKGLEILKKCKTGTDRRDKQKTGRENGKAYDMKGRDGDPEQSESKHYVFCFLKRSMAPLPLTSTVTRRKQADTPLLPVLHPVVYKLLRWRTDHRRHRLGVNRVPFIGVDIAGGPIRQPKHGWGTGRPMLSEPSNSLAGWKRCRLPWNWASSLKICRCVCDIRVSGGKSADVQYEVARKSLNVVPIQILWALRQLGTEVEFTKLRTF